MAPKKDPELTRRKLQPYLMPVDIEWTQEVVGPSKRFTSQSQLWDTLIRLGRLYVERLDALEAGVAEEAAHRDLRA